MNSFLTTVLQYAIKRLKEPSTLRGLVVLLATGAYSQSPEHVEQIVTAAGAVVGLLGSLLPDAPKAAE